MCVYIYIYIVFWGAKLDIYRSIYVLQTCMQRLLLENKRHCYQPYSSILATLCTILALASEFDALYQHLASRAYCHAY